MSGSLDQRRRSPRSDTRKSLLVALLTPLTREGGVDVAALQGHVKELLAAEVDGFFLCGTTGEGPLLDDDEVALVTRAVVSASEGQSFVTTQVGRPGTATTVRLLGLALDAGADGVTAVAPYYYALDDAHLEGHFTELLAAAGDAPLFAYTIPRCAGNDFSPMLVERLADRGLAGIKDSTRSLERHADYLRTATGRSPGSFAVYMGSDVLAHEALLRGSSGLVSALANVRPDLFVGLRAAVEEGRSEDAVGVQAEIDAVRESLSGGGIPGLKAAVAARMAARGVAYGAAARPPLGLPAR